MGSQFCQLQLFTQTEARGEMQSLVYYWNYTMSTQIFSWRGFTYKAQIYKDSTAVISVLGHIQ